jgi:RimJ/RimL family protein N-acetyltransferase
MTQRRGILFAMAIAELETPRLVLRPFESGDRDVLAALFAEESTWWYPLRRAMTAEETEQFIERQLERYRGPHPAVHAVIERSTGRLVGYAGLSVPYFLPEVLPAVELGWRFGEAFRGRGYATEAGLRAAQWGFDELGFDEIVSIFEPENIRSGMVMDRIGFDAGEPTVHPGRGYPLLVRRLSLESWRAQHRVTG